MKHKYLKPLLNQIEEWATLSSQREICGFLGYSEEEEQYVVQLERNASLQPAEFFSVDPFKYLQFCENYNLMAVFHSHVKGDEKPSEFDIKMAGASTHPFLIYSINSKKFYIYCPPNHEIDVNILSKLQEKVND